MSAENFLNKLHDRYLNRVKELTPVQIQKIINKNEFISDLSEKSGINNTYLLESVFFPNGKFLTYKAENFIESLTEFKNNYSDAESMLSFIDIKCIGEKTGKLITRRVVKRFKNLNFS